MTGEKSEKYRKRETKRKKERKQREEREKRREKEREKIEKKRKGEKKRKKMSRVNYHKSAFNSQKEKLNILAEMFKISKSGCGRYIYSNRPLSL